MAIPKKNQLLQIMFPMVDRTDFASIESGITASDFNSAATKKYYGINHGGSAAFTSGSISKATTLVHSGVFAQTIKAAEANYDFLMVRFTHPSCAEQIMTFNLATNDDTDIVSLISDVNSNLLSYLAGMSGMLSDVDSQLLLNASMISDVDSQVNLNASLASDAHSAAAQANSRALVIQSLVSDVDSQLLLNASMISDILSTVDSQFVLSSDFMSNVLSRVPKAVATNSQLSDLASDLKSYLAGISDVLSDLQSDFQSRVPKLVANNSQLSDLASDIKSAVAAMTATVSESDMSDIASRVWATTEGARVDSRIKLLQSNVSDIESALDSQFAGLSNQISATLSPLNDDIETNYNKILSALSAAREGSSRALVIESTLSDIDSALTSQASDLKSAIGTVGGTDYTSILSDIYSAAGQTNSRAMVIISTLSDIDSAVTSQASDLKSAIIAVTAAISASDMSDIASRVWATAIGAAVSSRIVLLQSSISDLESQLDLNASMISDVLSTVDSQFVLTSDFMSDVLSRVPKAVATASRLLLAESAISDAYSAAAQANSRAMVIESTLSDIDSALTSQASDLKSAIGAVTVTLDASDISDIASAVLVGFGSDLSDIYSAAQQTNSRMLVAQSNLSNIYALLGDVSSNVDGLSDILSDVYSNLGAGITVGASSLSAITSALLAGAGTSPIKANVRMVNDVSLTGNGTVGTPWGPE